MLRSVLLLLPILLFALPAPVAADPFGPYLNARRQAEGLRPLRPSPTLERAARRHASDMARRGYLSHTGRNGSTAMDRADRAGFRACLIVENIARGQDDAAEAMEDWIDSRPHRRNLDRRDVTHYGYANVKGDIHVLMIARPCRLSDLNR